MSSKIYLNKIDKGTGRQQGQQQAHLPIPYISLWRTTVYLFGNTFLDIACVCAISLESVATFY